MRKIDPSEITLEHIYLSRRKFMRSAATLASTLALTACGLQQSATDPAADSAAPASTATANQPTIALPANTATQDEPGQSVNTYEQITNYVNFYEFSTDKKKPVQLARNFKTFPWSIEVGGLVRNPTTYDAVDLINKFPQEERVYRLRCVEAWSMVIPWIGFPLAKLLEEVEPTEEAAYVRFETLFDPQQMPGQNSRRFDWPYVEGLRLDEAMHDLTLLATGIYGKPLLPQNGPPIRLVVPWKYGFKSIKSIVKIELVKEMPLTFWAAAAPNEYGFYANVNPNVDHPRWSQSTERRIGELGRRDTLMFNGYEEEVAALYEGMDLTTFF